MWSTLQNNVTAIRTMHVTSYGLYSYKGIHTLLGIGAEVQECIEMIKVHSEIVVLSDPLISSQASQNAVLSETSKGGDLYTSL